MFTKTLGTIICFFVLGILTTDISIARDARKSSTGRRVSSGEEMVLQKLGLSPDVNDTEILQLLDDPEKRSSAALLIRYRKISSAVPKLLEIVNDPNITFPVKLAVSKALCDFDNKEWMPVIKTFITDPNSAIISTPYAIKVAGLLARAGDYSHFELVAKSMGDSKWWIRHTAVLALANFRHKTDPVTDSALDLLTSTAMSDPMPRLRDMAIQSLEKIAEIRPDEKQRVIRALEANIDSPDKNLRTICNIKLKIYSKESEK